jgi:two-component system phosphate regulon sensor histidine kinase PhoR
MKNSFKLALLMLATILVIGGFQVYWLWQNYSREKKAIESRAQILFRETVFTLQGLKLNLDSMVHNDSLWETNVLPASEKINIPKRQVVSMVNIVNKQVDTLRKAHNKQLFVTVDRSSVFYKEDTLKNTTVNFKSANGNPIVRFLYDMDSLQDSIKIREVDSAYKRLLQSENLPIAFTVSKTNSTHSRFPDELLTNEVTIGIKNPVTYKVEIGNLFLVIIRRLSSPIMFSLFLVGFTVFSFVLLYRNLVQQKKLTAFKNDFISNITHELKTPIATVTVAIEALKNFNALNDPRRTKEYLDISANELQRLSLLVDKVLKLSMFENQAISLNKEWVDIKQLIGEVMESMRLQFEKQNAQVVLEAEDKDFTIHADKLHITSVVYNLLDNALKYSPRAPSIKISLRHHGHYIDLLIQDNGIGISPEYKEKIFEKFFRIPNENKHNIKGYGLGLSYVSHIAKSHQGFIEFESEPGKGSTFIVKLPVKEEPVIKYDQGRAVRKIEIKLGRNAG